MQSTYSLTYVHVRVHVHVHLVVVVVVVPVVPVVLARAPVEDFVPLHLPMIGGVFVAALVVLNQIAAIGFKSRLLSSELAFLFSLSRCFIR